MRCRSTPAGHLFNRLGVGQSCSISLAERRWWSRQSRGWCRRGKQILIRAYLSSKAEAQVHGPLQASRLNPRELRLGQHAAQRLA